ncbi:MAG: Lrp/AsnC family transcriptional regulator [Dehalococcoidales bacterium]|nr:Lrp/AsnC family transcriptional regulator [Dehalococcoidales bacterium]
MPHSDLIDETDRKIIIELQKDGRQEFSDLASKLNVSLSTISRRVDNLLKSKLIHITAVPNLQKLGYSINAIIGLDIEINKMESVCENLAANHNITFVAVTLGRYDVIITCYFITMEDLTGFVKDVIARIDGVTQIETFYVAELKKRTLGRLQDTQQLS